MSMEISTRAKRSIDIDVGRRASSAIDRGLHFGALWLGGEEGGAARQIGLGDFIRREHIEEIFPRQLANKQSFAEAWCDQSFVLEDRQRLANGSAADAERLGQAFLDQWLTALNAGVED